MKVKRKDFKPFKSGLRYNTVKEEVTHWKFGTPAYTFEEDDSCVEIRKCDSLDKWDINQLNLEKRNAWIEEAEDFFWSKTESLREEYKSIRIKSLDVSLTSISFKTDDKISLDFLQKLKEVLEADKINLVASGEGCGCCEYINLITMVIYTEILTKI